MSDLIEREAALCPKFTWSGRWNRRTIKIITEVMNKYGEYLAGLPSAPLEIIRCKECKHWDGKKNGGFCEVWDKYISNDAFFCGCATMGGEQE